MHLRLPVDTKEWRPQAAVSDPVQPFRTVAGGGGAQRRFGSLIKSVSELTCNSRAVSSGEDSTLEATVLVSPELSATAHAQSGGAGRLASISQGDEGEEEERARASAPRATRWHEVKVTPQPDPRGGGGGGVVLVVVQLDITERLEFEQRMAQVSEACVELLDGIFPRHGELEVWGGGVEAHSEVRERRDAHLHLCFAVVERLVASTAVAAPGQVDAKPTGPQSQVLEQLATSHRCCTLFFCDIVGECVGAMAPVRGCAAGRLVGSQRRCHHARASCRLHDHGQAGGA